jgi:hypothetical protein
MPFAPWKTLFEELNPIYYSRLRRPVSSIKHNTVPKPGGQAVSAPGPPQISNRVEGHLRKLTKAVLSGARAVLPTFRTTPVSVLHR